MKEENQDGPMRIYQHAKLKINMDSDGWLNIWDGHESVGLPPDDVEILRKFLAEGAAKPQHKSPVTKELPPGAGVDNAR